MLEKWATGECSLAHCPGIAQWQVFSRQKLVLRQTVYVCVGGGVLMRWSSALPTDVVMT